MSPRGNPYVGRRSWTSSVGGTEREISKRIDRERRRIEMEAMDEQAEAMEVAETELSRFRVWQGY